MSSTMDALVNYLGDGRSAGSMTLSSTTALTSTAVLSAVDTGKWAWSSSTVGKAYVKRTRQMQADLKTLTQKLETMIPGFSITGN